MKIVTLLENSTTRDDLTPQHGLSLYLETGTHRILFDMGQDDTFVKNAEKLGVDLSQVDIAIVSHGHYDHGGGLQTFLQINQKAPVYLHADAFGAYYNGTEKYIGLDPLLASHPRLIFTKGTMEIADGLLLTDGNDQGWCFDSWGLNRREEDTFLADDFRHEQYLLIREGEKRILISGCSHKGIVNLARHFGADVLIGGFHLNKCEDTGKLQQIARQLLAEKTQYYTGHCTGSRQFAFLKDSMADRLEYLSTGVIIEA